MNENIIHVAGIKLRVTGSGSLHPTLFGLDQAKSLQLNAINLQQINEFEPLQLTNFISQKAMLKLEVDNQDEYFTINRIVFYVKSVRTMIPG